jgi:hypothetical protein
VVFGGATRVSATFDNVQVQNSNFGVGVGNNVKLMIFRSVFAGNTQAGIDTEAGGEIHVDASVTSNNGTGIQNNSGTIRISNTDISFNSTAMGGTAVPSFGNNRLVGNNAAGTAPTPIGGVSNTFGQQ